MCAGVRSFAKIRRSFAVQRIAGRLAGLYSRTTLRLGPGGPITDFVAVNDPKSPNESVIVPLIVSPANVTLTRRRSPLVYVPSSLPAKSDPGAAHCSARA